MADISPVFMLRMRKARNYPAKLPCIFNLFQVELRLVEGSWRTRGIAQSGSAPALGAGCREFESLYPDHFIFIVESARSSIG